MHSYYEDDDDDYEGEGQLTALGSYEGERNYDDQRHGKGKAILPNGDKYEGEYYNGKRHGKGVYSMKSGEKYIGNYKCSEKYGYGEFYYIDGSVYKGNWLNNMKNGNGAYIYANGDIYEGEWVDSKRHGNGKYHYKLTGSTLEGTWKDGKLNGHGELIHQNHRYVGTYENGIPLGRGKYIFNGGYEQHGRYEVKKKEKMRKISQDENNFNFSPTADEDDILGENDKNVVWKPNRIVQRK